MGKITTALAAWALSIQKRAELSVAQAELGITVLEAVNVDRFNCELKALTGSDEQAEPIREFALDVAKSGIRPIELYPCLQGQPHVSRPNLTDMTDFALRLWQSKLDRECDATVAEMRTRLASSFPQCDPACTADCGRCKGGLVPGSPAAQAPNRTTFRSGDLPPLPRSYEPSGPLTLPPSNRMTWKFGLDDNSLRATFDIESYQAEMLKRMVVLEDEATMQVVVQELRKRGYTVTPPSEDIGPVERCRVCGLEELGHSWLDHIK